MTKTEATRPDDMKRPTTAMVMAAGLGKRMRPITDTLPKPLIEVAGKPLIDHMLERLAQAGVTKAVVNVHYLADLLEAHLRTVQAPRIVVSDERERLLDQGGGILKALPDLGPDPFFICNTDAFWLEGPRSNVDALARAWDPERMDVLLLVAPTVSSIGVDWAGDFTMDADGRLTKRREGCVAPFAYAGIGIFKPSLLADPPGEVFGLARYFFAAAAEGRLHGVRLDGLWLHVGTPQAVAEAERQVAASAA